MRKYVKGDMPAILAANKDDWDTAFAALPLSATAKYRYRHPEIKSSLIKETHSKCIYCESKVGHNTPGDVEHLAPSSIYPALHFDWNNLTIACTECNRRKSNYDTIISPFLNPYGDDVENRVVHLGPLTCAAAGDAAVEICVSTLQLDKGIRIELILRKIEKIAEINSLKSRIRECTVPALKALLEADLQRRGGVSEEYSGMVSTLI